MAIWTSFLTLLCLLYFCSALAFCKIITEFSDPFRFSSYSQFIHSHCPLLLYTGRRGRVFHSPIRTSPVLLFISSMVLLKNIPISFPLIHLQFSFSYSLKKSTSFHLACCNFTNTNLITFQFDTEN